MADYTQKTAVETHQTEADTHQNAVGKYRMASETQKTAVDKHQSAGDKYVSTAETNRFAVETKELAFDPNRFAEAAGTLRDLGCEKLRRSAAKPAQSLRTVNHATEGTTRPDGARWIQ